MDQLYAPWRIEWVERDSDPVDGCPFCVLPDRDADRESRIVARGDSVFLLLNNAPYNPGHAMVIPYEHTGELGDLDDATMLESMQLRTAAITAMREAMGPDGFNTGTNLGGAAAGGSIGDHLHVHVVPRFEGDTNFMPVVGDSKVIVEAVDRTYRRLHAAFRDHLAAVDDGLDADGEPVDAVRLSF